MSDDPHAVAPVRRVDGASWNNERLNVVAEPFQVSAHLLEDHAPLHSKQATHVLSDDPARSELADDAKHLRPEIAVVPRAASLSGLGEGLAGKAAGDEVDAAITSARILPPFRFGLLPGLPALGVGSQAVDVVDDADAGPVLPQHGLAEGLALAERERPVILAPNRLSRESKAADAAEEIEMGEGCCRAHSLPACGQEG